MAERMLVHAGIAAYPLYFAPHQTHHGVIHDQTATRAVVIDDLSQPGWSIGHVLLLELTSRASE
jgi:hypothetical protein